MKLKIDTWLLVENDMGENMIKLASKWCVLLAQTFVI